MRTLSLIRATAITLFLFAATTARANEAPKPAASDREAVLAKLKANGVNLNGLTIAAKDGGPAVNLGTGENSGEANSANDENLRLVAWLPEVERVSLFKGKFTKDGLAALAALPKLRYLQVYACDVPAEAFSILGELKGLKALELGEYRVTDELLGYAGAVRGLKRLEITRTDGMTPAGVAKFLDSVDGLEGLLLFGDVIDDACMKRIGQMKDMKRFWTDSKKITPAAWGNLAGLTKMKDLFLRGTSFDDAGMRALEGMRDIESLILTNTQVTDTGMTSLAGLTKLHDLGLDGTKITDQGMANLKGMTELDNLYVGMTDVTAKGLAFVPKKERMSMMRTGKAALTPKEFGEVMGMYPQTQIFDPSGYWTTDRIQAAMKELRKEVPMPKK